ncbi:helix-turn-helix domain-containing protein [Sulfobacillus thermosulfidooxidans]|uniref:helix-turn-helix domain-containing protein n=1 Tax=Sulfobacillus thermosulfidooxidans TaxID=28034 RepID=UPI0006B47AE6|nr:helix-turn-helix transcriptional regulator [Sulfobacillus thermosulfidooxidans]
MKHNSLHSIVATNLRKWRQTRGLSVNELAKKANIAKGTLSQLERGLANPTLDTLWTLSQALGVSFGTLITPDTASFGETFEVDDQFGQTSLLARDHADFGVVETYRMNLRARTRREAKAHPPGVFEVVTGIRGDCQVGPLDSLRFVHAGDVLTFFADRPHVYETGEEGCEIMVVIFYPELPHNISLKEKYLSWPLAWSISHNQFLEHVYTGLLPVAMADEVFKANSQSSTHRTFLIEIDETAFYRFAILPMGRPMADMEDSTREYLIRSFEGEGLIIDSDETLKDFEKNRTNPQWAWLYFRDQLWTPELFDMITDRLLPGGRLMVSTPVLDPFSDLASYQRSYLLYHCMNQLSEWPQQIIPKNHALTKTLKIFQYSWEWEGDHLANDSPQTILDNWLDAKSLMDRIVSHGFRILHHYRVAGFWSSSEWSSGRHIFVFGKGT